MSGAAVQITIDDAALRAALKQLTAHVSDMQPVFADIAEMVLETTKARFEATVGPDDIPWDSLLPKTIARKKKPADSILVETGTLLDQLVALSDSDSAQVGSNIIYAATHQFGDIMDAIPARPFLGIDQNDQNDIITLLRIYLEEGMQPPVV